MWTTGEIKFSTEGCRSGLLGESLDSSTRVLGSRPAITTEFSITSAICIACIRWFGTHLKS